MNTALVSSTISDDPLTYKEPMLNPQKNWREAAIMDEFNFILQNEMSLLAYALFSIDPIGS